MDTRYINIPVIYKLFIPRQKEFYRNFVNRFPPMFIVSMTKSAFKRLNTGQTFFFFFPWPQFRWQTDRTTTIGLGRAIVYRAIGSIVFTSNQVNFWSRRSRDFAVLLPMRESCIDDSVNRCFPFARLEQPIVFCSHSIGAGSHRCPPRERISPACVLHCALQRSRAQMARAFPLLKIITDIPASMRDNCIRVS